MSRLGKKPVLIPKGVAVKVQDKHVSVQGPKGSLELSIQKRIQAKVEGNEVVLNVEGDEHNRFLGLYRALIQSMVKGVTVGFTKQLELEGIGFRAQVQGQKLSLTLGFSHPCEVEIPKGIEVKIDKSVLINISGPSSQLVGQFAAQIREIKKPEPYK